MKRQFLTLTYVSALLCATGVFAYALIRVHGRLPRLADPVVIITCNAAFWAFIWHVITVGHFKSGGKNISLSGEPKRFIVYVFVLLFAGVVASVIGALILISKVKPD